MPRRRGFEWIPQEVGYPKAYQLLKRGGSLALFWNHPSIPEGKPYFDMQRVYDKYMPSSHAKSKVHTFNGNSCEKIANTIAQYGFVEIRYRLYDRIRCLYTDDYIALLKTYSDHRTLAECKWVQLEQELRSAIEENGGQVTIRDKMDLYLAKKP